MLSPELVLVDPALQAEALRALPPVEPFDFLRFRERALRPVGDPGATPSAPHAPAAARRPPLLVAALTYLIASAATFVPVGALLFVAVALVVAALNLIG